MKSQQILGSGIVLGSILLLSLICTGVLFHPAGIQGPGLGLFHTDVSLLALYGFAGVIVCKLRSPSSMTAAIIGATTGLVLAAVGIANHLIEAFVPARPFVLVIGPVLMTFGFLGSAGAAAWERTRSLWLAVLSGFCCGVVGTLITLGFATSFNLLFAARVDWRLREAFAASGMTDPAAFRVRNILEAASEILVRMPLLAICFAFAAATIQAWISCESRRKFVRPASWLAALFFAVGAATLWYANGIERAGRPPFVLAGVLLTGVALCTCYPIWWVLHGSTGRQNRIR